MGWRFRKSIPLGKGVRLDFSKRGIGLSVGVRGGTGVYYEQRLGSGRRIRRARGGPAGCATVILVATTATVLTVAVVSWIR